jgi:hypothetical protein
LLAEAGTFAFKDFRVLRICGARYFTRFCRSQRASSVIRELTLRIFRSMSASPPISLHNAPSHLPKGIVAHGGFGPLARIYWKPSLSCNAAL